MRLKKITIRGFRGFNKEETILFDGDIILIYGLNGSGKSSLTEAIEWLFFDEISRYRLSRCPGEYRYEDYLRNHFYEDVIDPFVEVEGSINSKNVVVRKQMIPDGNKFFINGAEALDLGNVGINLESYYRPMLAQTEIKALVDSEQKERWEQLSNILGQDILTRLRNDLISLKNNKRDDAFKASEQLWHTLSKEINKIPEFSQLQDSIRNLNISDFRNNVKEIVGSIEDDLDSLAASIRQKQKAILNSELGNRVTEITYEGSEALSNYLQQIEKKLEITKGHAIQASEKDFDHSYLDFLENGLQMASPPKCPFCLQGTFSAERKKIIQADLDARKESKERLIQFRKNKSEISITISDFEKNIAQFYPSVQKLKEIYRKLLKIEEKELTIKTVNLSEKLMSVIKASNSEFNASVSEVLENIEKKYILKEKIDEVNFIKVKGKFNKMIRVHGKISTMWENLKLEIAKKTPPKDKIDEKEIEKWIFLGRITDFFKDSTLFIKKNTLLNTLENIRIKLEDFEKSEVARLITVHGEEIKKYYSRLNEGDEIQFSGIEVKGGTRRQAKLKAEAYGKPINPITTFSEAHTNSLALSIYFPQRVDRNVTWKCVLLDDPVQSMDDNHSQALIEIIADISNDKQVIILTHSKKFYRSLLSRFPHLKVLAYNFYNNDESGPCIEQDKGELFYYLDKIEEYCQKGDSHSLEDASHKLRKAFENVCIEYLLGRGDIPKKAKKAESDGISVLFSRCIQWGLPRVEIGKMKSMLDTSNENSHAWSIEDDSPANLRQGVKYIRSIYDNYIK